MTPTRISELDQEIAERQRAHNELAARVTQVRAQKNDLIVETQAAVSVLENEEQSLETEQRHHLYEMNILRREREALQAAADALDTLDDSDEEKDDFEDNDGNDEVTGEDVGAGEKDGNNRARFSGDEGSTGDSPSTTTTTDTTHGHTQDAEITMTTPRRVPADMTEAPRTWFYDAEGNELPKPSWGLTYRIPRNDHTSDVRFYNCRFDELSVTLFYNCKLEKVTFTECDFSNVKFIDVEMENTHFRRCTFWDGKCRDWRGETGSTSLIECRTFGGGEFDGR